MSDPLLRLQDPRPVERWNRPAAPVGRQLVEAGLISSATLLNALELQRYIDAPLGEILVAEGHVSRSDVLSALAIQYDTDRIDLARDPPAPAMAAALSAALCQAFGAVPWRWLGSTLLVATTRPDRIEALRAALPATAPKILAVIAEADLINVQIGRLYGPELAHRAITRVPEEFSCRSWSPIATLGVLGVGGILAALTLSIVFATTWFATFLILCGLLTLLMTTSLKAAALLTQITNRIPINTEPLQDLRMHRLPQVSVLVPLFREERIAQALIKRLSRLTYPKALLEVVLVLEAKDSITRATLDRTELPQWMRVIEVPDDGTITTKPRALNYALDFCHGSIIGVWDAEDAPEPDQIEKVVSRFGQAAPNVACVQGILDYYNCTQNWLSRCFTIEYATWWRLVLPGVERLRMVLPLGGTTLFFRRDVLEELGGWDAHNVAEDADLGLRLARRGYKTELLPTVTYEEANCRAWRWVKQRSRWLKGFLITYCVHMRRPKELLRDLGWRSFMGVQAMFLATVLQFASLPLLWSFWLPSFGLHHPVVDTLGTGVIVPIAMLVISSEVIGLLISLLAVSAKERRHLIPWVLTMPIYFMLGALASYKALYELALNPFYWDKTQHGMRPNPLPFAYQRPASDGS